MDFFFLMDSFNFIMNLLAINLYSWSGMNSSCNIWPNMCMFPV